jgi:hypothetical protein
MRAYVVSLIPVTVLFGLTLAPAARAADPKQECVSAADEGQTARDDGKYRKARELFITCSRSICPSVVLKSCAQWLREVDQDAPTVVLGAKDDGGNDLSTVKVTFDGQPIADQLDGKPIQVDLGEHTLRFEHEGAPPVEQHIVFRAGEKNRAVVVTFHRDASPSATAAPTSAPPDVAPSPCRSEPVDASARRHPTALEDGAQHHDDLAAGPRCGERGRGHLLRDAFAKSGRSSRKHPLDDANDWVHDARHRKRATVSEPERRRRYAR